MEFIYWIAESQRQMVTNFIYAKADPTIFDSDGFSEQEFFERLEFFGDEATKFDVYASKLLLSCFFNQVDRATEFETKAQQFEEDTTSRQINFPSFLYSSIWSTTLNLEEGKIANTKKLRSRLNKKLKLLKLIAKHAPENYENKYLLAQAWIQRSKKNYEAAEKLFIQSIEKAKSGSLVHEEALAREHLARLYDLQGKTEFSELMYEKALRKL